MTTLTHAEHSLIRLVVRGLADKDIATERGTSHLTVRNQLQTLRRKFGARNRTQLAMYAIRNGLSSPQEAL